MKKTNWRIIDLVNNKTSYKKMTLDEVKEIRKSKEYNSMVIERPIFDFNRWTEKLPEDSFIWN